MRRAEGGRGSRQLEQLISDLRKGCHFQFAAASVWLTHETGRPNSLHPAAAMRQHAPLSGTMPPSGTDPNPRVRLSHFARLSMHRDAGANECIVQALVARRAALAHAAPPPPAALE